MALYMNLTNSTTRILVPALRARVIEELPSHSDDEGVLYCRVWPGRQHDQTFAQYCEDGAYVLERDSSSSSIVEEIEGGRCALRRPSR